MNLFDACGLTGTRFEVTLLLREGEPGEQVEALRVPGQVLAAQANGGAGLGLYVTSFTIQ